MYTLFLDKPKTFEAKIKVEGSNSTDKVARLLIEGDGTSLIFNGNITKSGYIKAPINKLKKYFSEGTTGKIKCEVIIDGMYFVPWEEQFKTVSAVKVETIDKGSSRKNAIASRPIVKVEHADYSLEDKLLSKISTIFSKNDIRLENFNSTKSKSKFNSIVKVILKHDVDSNYIQEGILNILKNK